MTNRAVAGHRGARGQVFDVADDIVTRVSDRSTGEWGQSINMRHLHTIDKFAEFFQRVINRFRETLSTINGRDFPVGRAQPQMRFDGQKAVTTDSFTADNTFKQARVTSGINSAKCGYRRQRVAQDPSKNGYGIIVAGQLDELLLIWIVTHRCISLVNA